MMDTVNEVRIVLYVDNSDLSKEARRLLQEAGIPFTEEHRIGYIVPAVRLERVKDFSSHHQGFHPFLSGVRMVAHGFKHVIAQQGGLQKPE